VRADDDALPRDDVFEVNVPAVRLEVDAVTATKLVVVALVAVRLVKNPDTAVRKEEKRLVLVANVVEAFVATRLVAVAFVILVLPRVVCPDTVTLVAEALPSAVCPVTESVPPTVWLPEIDEVPTDAVFAVRLVATAFVVVELPTRRSVKEARVAMSDEKNPLVAVADVRFALVAVRLPVVRLEVDALPSTV
jgi:hypothetical protein